MRKNYIDWDIYFMGLAKLSAMRSKDPQLQVGAIIVDERNRVLGLGYNGAVNHWKDQDIPWNKINNTYFKTKLPYIVCAEQNAIYNSFFEKIRGSHMYSTTLPCANCAKSIIQVGIKKVYYLSDSLDKIPEFKESFVFARKLFAQARVELIFKKKIEKNLNDKIFRSE